MLEEIDRSFEAWKWAQRQQRTADVMVGAADYSGWWLMAAAAFALTAFLALILIWM